MNSAIGKLANIAGPPLGRPLGEVEDRALNTVELRPLLSVKNGFYAFESALHVFPVTPVPGERGLHDWNAAGGWRADYQGLADGCTFFAEDLFGGQFCLFDGAVMLFDPETGSKEFVAATTEDWAECILKDYDVLTGWPLAHEWQARNGPIPRSERLVPKLPFVLGGEFNVENLYALAADEAMRFRANLAVRIKDLPDGAEVTLRVTD